MKTVFWTLIFLGALFPGEARATDFAPRAEIIYPEAPNSGPADGGVPFGQIRYPKPVVYPHAPAYVGGRTIYPEAPSHPQAEMRQWQEPIRGAARAHYLDPVPRMSRYIVYPQAPALPRPTIVYPVGRH